MKQRLLFLKIYYYMVKNKSVEFNNNNYKLIMKFKILRITIK